MSQKWCICTDLHIHEHDPGRVMLYTPVALSCPSAVTSQATVSQPVIQNVQQKAYADGQIAVAVNLAQQRNWNDAKGQRAEHG